MSYFKAIMHELSFRLGLRPQTPLGELTVLPRLLAGFKGPTFNGKGSGKEKA